MSAPPIPADKLARCVASVASKACPPEAKNPDGSWDTTKCKYSPVAVCRASIGRYGRRRRLKK